MTDSPMDTPSKHQIQSLGRQTNEELSNGQMNLTVLALLNIVNLFH